MMVLGQWRLRLMSGLLIAVLSLAVSANPDIPSAYLAIAQEYRIPPALFYAVALTRKRAKQLESTSATSLAMDVEYRWGRALLPVTPCRLDRPEKGFA